MSENKKRDRTDSESDAKSEMRVFRILTWIKQRFIVLGVMLIWYLSLGWELFMWGVRNVRRWLEPRYERADDYLEKEHPEAKLSPSVTDSFSEALLTIGGAGLGALMSVNATNTVTIWTRILAVAFMFAIVAGVIGKWGYHNDDST
jgi:hypothetical protein